MSLDRIQIRSLIVDITRAMGLETEDSTNLLMGTCAQESHLGTYIEQVGGGPAQGIFQMEGTTERDIWNNYLFYRPELRDKVVKVTGRDTFGAWLKWDLAYQVAMARIHYLRVSQQLPKNILGYAKYYKQHYNTEQGAATIAEFLDNYDRLVQG